MALTPSTDSHTETTGTISFPSLNMSSKTPPKSALSKGHLTPEQASRSIFRMYAISGGSRTTEACLGQNRLMSFSPLYLFINNKAGTKEVGNLLPSQVAKLNTTVCSSPWRQMLRTWPPEIISLSPHTLATSPAWHGANRKPRVWPRRRLHLLHILRRLCPGLRTPSVSLAVMRALLYPKWGSQRGWPCYLRLCLSTNNKCREHRPGKVN